MHKKRRETKIRAVTEGAITIHVPLVATVSKEMDTFYNPVMKFNRDITVLFLNALAERVSVADVMAATGIRSLRIFKESKNVSSLLVNDVNTDAVNAIERNCKKNNIPFVKQKKYLAKGMKTKKIFLYNKDANQLLLESHGFSYIDIDPFGTPNPFLDAAIKRVARGGYLGVTATDTAALCGTYENACKRKYDAKPLRTFMMHEVGLRILIKKIQTIGAQYDKAMIPVFTFSKDHYMRIFFKCEKSKEAVDIVLSQHRFILFCHHCFSMKTSEWNKEICVCGKEYDHAGRLWIGDLWDQGLVSSMKEIADKGKNKEITSFFKRISEEMLIASPFVYDISKVCKKYKCSLKKIDFVIHALKERGFPTARTHVVDQGIRTIASVQEILKILVTQKSLG